MYMYIFMYVHNFLSNSINLVRFRVLNLETENQPNYFGHVRFYLFVSISSVNSVNSVLTELCSPMSV